MCNFLTVDSGWAADSDSDAGDLKDTGNTEGYTKIAGGSEQTAESADQVGYKVRWVQGGLWYIANNIDNVTISHVCMYTVYGCIM